MDYIFPLLTLLLGLALGGGAAWLVLRAKAAAAYDRGRAEASAETAALSEKVVARDELIEELRGRLAEKDAALVRLQEEVKTLGIAAAELRQALAAEQKQAQEKLALLDNAKQQLTDAFRALAGEALKSSNTSFLELAKTHLEKFQESARGDLEKRQTAIDELVKPVKESLGKVDAKLQEIEKTRIEAYSGLTEQVKSLSESQKDLRTETANLVKALRRPQARGRWGEIQLRRVVEMAGMLEHCDFVQQQSTDTDDGRLRPDLIVKLPGARTSWSTRRPRWRRIWRRSRPPTTKRGRRSSRTTPGRSASTSPPWGGRPISSSSTSRPSSWCCSCPARCFSARRWRTIPS